MPIRGRVTQRCATHERRRGAWAERPQVGKALDTSQTIHTVLVILWAVWDCECRATDNRVQVRVLAIVEIISCRTAQATRVTIQSDTWLLHRGLAHTSREFGLADVYLSVFALADRRMF